VGKWKRQYGKGKGTVVSAEKVCTVVSREDEKYTLSRTGEVIFFGPELYG
jgi:hypothetical protein